MLEHELGEGRGGVVCCLHCIHGYTSHDRHCGGGRDSVSGASTTARAASIWRPRRRSFSVKSSFDTNTLTVLWVNRLQPNRAWFFPGTYLTEAIVEEDNEFYFPDDPGPLKSYHSKTGISQTRISQKRRSLGDWGERGRDFQSLELSRFRISNGMGYRFEILQATLAKPVTTHGVAYSFLSKEDIRLILGMLTGHGPLMKHLMRVGLSQTEECRLCGEEEESAEHIWLNCPGISEIPSDSEDTNLSKGGANVLLGLTAGTNHKCDCAFQPITCRRKLGAPLTRCKDRKWNGNGDDDVRAKRRQVGHNEEEAAGNHRNMTGHTT
ncbi:hypothetical protein J6590_065297 [Homalodisca vitripennis]|nr:hypothetical protein J6590_065297 [Homalodisca vitripennis]